jgi:hypothetical protein
MPITMKNIIKDDNISLKNISVDVEMPLSNEDLQLLKDMTKFVYDSQNKEFDENGDPIRGLDQIYSIGILEELIAYNRKGNFDRVMALMQVMFQDQEDLIGKEYKPQSEGNKKAKQLLDMMDNRAMPKNYKSKNLFNSL